MSGLTVDALTAGYVANPVLKDISLSIGGGEAVCVIGSNGAGKSTLLRALSGLVPWQRGNVTFYGDPIGPRPHSRARLGIAHVPEGRWVFPDLSVRDHLELGGRLLGPKDRRAQIAAMLELFPALDPLSARSAGTLSGGEQQMVAIARAMMSRPKLLMLDEPSLGLAPVLVEKIFEALRELHARGLAVLLVEQNARLALSFASRGYVLRLGRVVAADSASSLRLDDHVREAYLGKRADGDPKAREQEPEVGGIR